MSENRVMYSGGLLGCVDGRDASFHEMWPRLEIGESSSACPAVCPDLQVLEKLVFDLDRGQRACLGGSLALVLCFDCEQKGAPLRAEVLKGASLGHRVGRVAESVLPDRAVFEHGDNKAALSFEAIAEDGEDASDFVLVVVKGSCSLCLTPRAFAPLPSLHERAGYQTVQVENAMAIKDRADSDHI